MSISANPEKTDSRGHSLYSPQERRRIINAFERSGLSVRAYAEQHAIKKTTLSYWLKQRRQGSSPTRKPKISPPTHAPTFAELDLPALPRPNLGAAVDRGWVEIMLPSGVVVRVGAGMSSAGIVELVHALQGRGC